MFDYAKSTEEFLMRWEMCNAVRKAHGLPEMLWGEARALIPNNY